jgi:radical SAM protein (TIGR01212 family)
MDLFTYPKEKIFRYNHFGRYLRTKYGYTVHKVNIDAGFTCPNRDKETATGGCIYCDNRAFNKHSYHEIEKSVRQQLSEGIAQKKRIYKIDKVIAYFQAYTNTYENSEYLKKQYDLIREFPEIMGLSIGTRPDCIDNEKLDLIESYADDYIVWVEYGLQSANDKTLQTINRGHNFQQFLDAIEITKNRKISLCVHLIIGLPGESYDDMMRTADLLSGLPIDGIKLHNMCVVKDTRLHEMYMDGSFKPMGFDEYIQTSVDFLERIPYEITVQRLTADSPPDIFVSPEWANDRFSIVNAIENEFIRRDSFQGIKC